MNVLHRAIIKKLERLAKEKSYLCRSAGHPNSELDKIIYRKNIAPLAYMRCKDCGSTYTRNATQEEILDYDASVNLQTFYIPNIIHIGF